MLAEGLPLRFSYTSIVFSLQSIFMIVYVMATSLTATLTFADIEKILLLKQRQLEEQLETLELSDPVLLDVAPEPGELGTDAWQADVHAKSEVLKGSILQMSAKVKRSLHKLRNGTYGKCDNCQKMIEDERLKAIPTAILCTGCAALTKSS